MVAGRQYFKWQATLTAQARYPDFSACAYLCLDHLKQSAHEMAYLPEEQPIAFDDNEPPVFTSMSKINIFMKGLGRV